MKKNSKLILLIVTILLLGVGFSIFTGVGQIKSNNSFQTNNGLQIEISSLKNTYLLGETVFLDFEVKNNSSTDIRVKGVDLDSNYVSIYIAFEGKTFKKYTHSRVKEGKWWMLKAGQIVTSRSGILWNFSPTKTSASLNELNETHILTDYAFPEPGVYLIKAVLGIPNNENSIKIESKPIQILINEPIGDELKVWNQIKNRDDFAYFIQEGEFKTSKLEEEVKLLGEIEKITAEYPNSILASQMKKSLEKFRESEEKLKENLQKKQKN